MAVNRRLYLNAFNNIYVYVIWVKHPTLMAVAYMLFFSLHSVVISTPIRPSANQKTDLGPISQIT